MGRLILVLALSVMVAANIAFAATEKENQEQREILRLSTLQNELNKEEKSLHRLQEELTFYMASGEGSPERISEIKDEISASEDNIKFLNAEIQKARGEKPQAVKGKKPVEDVPQKGNRKWWDVYSREKTIQ